MASLSQRTLTFDDLITMRYPTEWVPLALSPDGRWLAATLQGPHEDLLADTLYTAQGVQGSLLGSRIVLIHTDTGDMHEPFPGTSWAPQWAPDGTRLAAFVQHEGHTCLALYDQESGSARFLRDIPVRPYFGFEAPVWLPDSTRLIVKRYTPRSAPEADAIVTVYRFHPDEVESPSETDFRYYTGDLLLVDTQSGHGTVLAERLAFTTVKVSPDGRAVAVTHDVEYDAPRYKRYSDMTVFPLDGSPAVTVARHVINDWGVFSWSPNSQYLAFTSGSEFEDGELFLVPADGTSTPINLSEGSGLNLAHQFRLPHWRADGTAIYKHVGQDFWCFPIDGTPPHKTTPTLSAGTVYTWMLPPAGKSIVLDDLTAVPVLYACPSIGEDGCAMLNLHTGALNKTATNPEGLHPVNGGMECLLSGDGRVCFSFLGSATVLPEIWRQDVYSGETKKISHLNITLDTINPGSIRQIEWTMPDGNTLHGSLLLPPHYRQGERVPLVVEGYAGGPLSQYLRGIGQSGLFINPYILAAEGYAVLYPDLPLDKKNIRRHIGEMINAAVDHVIALGVVDADRLAIVGQSYGGYTALCGLTCTTRFKAAVVSAAISDLLRLYAQMDNQGCAFNVGYCETGQGGIRGTVWEKLDRYLEESPFYHLDQVQTPLLLFAGTKDSLANDQAQAVFIGLRRLGVPVELRLYHGEQHAPIEWSGSRKRDFYQHTLSWLARYLGQ